MTMKSAVTICLVDEARQGPFVLHDGLEAGFQTAKEFGYDAVEIFAPAPDAVNPDELRSLVEKYELGVAAVGTGAGMVKHGLSLVDADPEKRQQAIEFIKSMIDFGGPFGAPAIIGSMQGKWGGDIDREAALNLLRDALNELGPYAGKHNVALIYEPLNRYETNLITTVADGVDFLKTLSTDNVKLLADLFHMNIEEANIADAIRAGAGHIGHVHFVDSNRRAAGLGHMDFGPIGEALREIDYQDYASVEAFPLPDALTTTRMTIEAYREYLQA